MSPSQLLAEEIDDYDPSHNDSTYSDFDDDDIEPDFPSSASNLGPAKKPKGPKPKVVKRKAKAEARAEQKRGPWWVLRC